MPKTKSPPQFHRPVVVQLGRIDRDRIVSTTKDAAELLLRHWPAPECVQREKAMRACLDVIRGTKPARVARHAFIDAARTAGVLITD